MLTDRACPPISPSGIFRGRLLGPGYSSKFGIGVGGVLCLKVRARDSRAVAAFQVFAGNDIGGSLQLEVER
jgi:hypothetical protein